MHTTFEHEGREFFVVSVPVHAHPMPEVLSQAEQEVVRLALSGLSNEGIAMATGRAKRTVANLLARACRKLGVRRRTELAGVLGRGQAP